MLTLTVLSGKIKNDKIAFHAHTEGFLLVKTCDLFDLAHTLAWDYLSSFGYPWEALEKLKNYIPQLGKTLHGGEYTEILPEVWAHKTASVSRAANIVGPCIIGAGTEVRPCAYIRGCALIGENCVVGNSTELKNVILFDCVQTPHYNYVGDSILGYKAHMGAGAVTSNVKADKTPVTVKGETKIETGLKKLGSMIGDFAEVGCNAVLNPGTVVGRNTNIYPLSFVRGVVPPDSILKNDGILIKKN